MTGTKHDADKPKMHLLSGYHRQTLIDEVRVLEFGAERYGEENWKTVDNALQRYKNALARHVHALQHGEQIDPDSGLPHTAHIRVNAAFIEWFEGQPPSKQCWL